MARLRDQTIVNPVFRLLGGGVASLILAGTAPAWAIDVASRDDAVAMVKRGVDFFKENGKEKTFAEITDKRGRFQDRDLYLVVYGMDGVVYAHGANERLVGRNLIESKDTEGRPMVRERVELARSKGVFWQDYTLANPITKTVEPRQVYCERVMDAIVCAGVYKR